MASGIYQRFWANLANKVIDLEADTIRAMLLASSHSFNAAHNTKSQIGANEISGTGYTAGGVALTGLSVTQGAVMVWDGNDAVWTGASFTAAFAVLYDDTLAGDDLICCFDLGGDQAVTAGTFTLAFDAGGIITLEES